MRQLLLDLGAVGPPTLESFVIGRNEELAAILHRIACREATSLDQHFITLWGEAGAGKSHLLFALAAGGSALYLSADQPAENYVWSPSVPLYLLDDCDRLDADQQIAAFALYNQIRESGGMLVAATGRPPAQLALREDLRTRLAWGLVYQVHGLSDEEKIDALSKSADARGMVLSPGVLPYLLTHFRRDMSSLSAILDALDRYSLETQRPITMPLLRELLQLGDAQPTS
ncbi:MAG: DnaA regulatory inactivator Hda [Oxalobacteraceae bacterium]|nr:DnaA regulatory inactivator Hda [Oxalobacteraceae bacterium]